MIVVTTSYGRTLAIDARTGAKLWQFTPSDIGSYAGSAQFTTASPTADPDHRDVYAATPDGEIHKLRWRPVARSAPVAGRHGSLSTRPTRSSPPRRASTVAT